MSKHKSKSEPDVAPKLSKAEIIKSIKKNKLNFSDNEYEADNSKLIIGDKLKLSEFKKYLITEYGSGTKPKAHNNSIAKIFDNKEIENIIQKDASEYYKMLTLCVILSKAKMGWADLFVCKEKNSQQLYLDAGPSRAYLGEQKKYNDKIINFFYSQLSSGIPDEKKYRHIKTLFKNNPSHPSRNFIYDITESINSIFDFYLTKGLERFDDKHRQATCFAAIRTRKVLRNFLRKNDSNSSQDGIRLSLMKFAAINEVINSINAEYSQLSENKQGFPEEEVSKIIKILELIISQNAPLDKGELIKLIEMIYFSPDTSTPTDLIECAKVVCKIFLLINPNYFGLDGNNPPTVFIALSAILLYDDFLNKALIITRIPGEINKEYKLYKKLSDFTKTNPLDKFEDLGYVLTKIPRAPFLYYLMRFQYALTMFSREKCELVYLDAMIKSQQVKIAITRNALQLLKKRNLLMLESLNINLQHMVEIIHS